MFAALMNHLYVLIDLPLLIVLTSLVYSAQRHENWTAIGWEAFRWGARLALFMGAIVVGLVVVSWL